MPRDPAHTADVSRRYSLVQFLQDYHAGALSQKCYAVLFYETAKLGSGRLPAMPTRRRRVYQYEDGALGLERRAREARAANP